MYDRPPDDGHFACGGMPGGGKPPPYSWNVQIYTNKGRRVRRPLGLWFN